MKYLITSILFVLGVLGTATLPAHVAYAQQKVDPIPLGEITYDQAYVPCGYADTLGSNGLAAEQIITTGYEEKIVDGKKVSTPITKTIPGDGVVDNPCQFTHIIEFAKKLITGLIILGVIIATMGFAYAGLLYITAMGSTEKISHAHSIFVKTFWGFVFMLSAWLIAYTMESIFLSDTARCNSFLLTPAEKAKIPGCSTTP